MNGTTLDFTGGTHNFGSANFGGAGLVRVSGGTMTIAAATAINNPFTLTGTGTVSGAGNLTLNGAFTFGGGTMSGAGSFVTNATTTLNNQATLDGRNWSLFGDMGLNGRLVLANGAVLTNSAGLTLTLAGTNATPFFQGTGAPGSVINNGVLSKTNAAQHTFTTQFANAGSVSVVAGDLLLAQGGTHSGGFDIATGSILQFSGGTHTLNAGAAFTGAGLTRVAGATLNVNASPLSLTDLVLQSGALTGTGAVNVNGAFNWTGGTLSGTGLLTTNAATTISASGGTLIKNWLNNGTVDLLGAALLNVTAGNTFTNVATGTFNVASTNSNPLGGAGAFDNQGTLNKDAGLTQTFTTVLTNSGTVNVNNGALNLTTLNLSGGIINNGADDALTVANFNHTGGVVGPGFTNLSLTDTVGDFSVLQFFSATSGLTLAAPNGNLIIGFAQTAPAINLSGANVTVDSAQAGFNAITTALSVTTPGTLTVAGNTAAAKLEALNTMTINAGAVNVIAGAFSASIDPSTLALNTGSLTIQGGAAPGAFATVDGGTVNLNATTIMVQGGSGDNSYAGILGGPGNSTINATTINLIMGSGLDSDAVIGTPSGGMTINTTNCVGCTVLAGLAPIGNAATDGGLFGNPVTLNLPVPIEPLVEVDNSIVYAATLAEDGGEANAEYEDDEEESEGTTDENDKAPIPVCI